MKQFYSRLSLSWFELPAVALAFGEDYQRSAAARVSRIKRNIRDLHKAKELDAIKPIDFLNTLHTKGILHTLPDALSDFKDERLLSNGLYGHYYKDLYRLGWFNAPKVATAFQVKHEQDPKERERKIKGAIYWELGVVSLSQVHPRDFCELVIDRGIGFTLPQSLVQAAGGGHA